KNGVHYDVIFDVTGRMPYARMLRSLKPGGRYVLANPRVRDMLRAPLTNLTSNKRVIFRFAPERPEDLAYLLKLSEQSMIRPVIDKVFPLNQTAEAHRYVEAGRKTGCVVIAVK
ncbi:MAG: zinc-binding dehydrogenase, partial [Saprospiraceae bacterium]|nr:zinc-binding dehydrogenase [Saprospiraceae bacterium]